MRMVIILEEGDGLVKMTLVDARIGEKLEVKGVQGGRCRDGCGQGILSGLATRGLHVGDRVRVLRAAPFRGPVLVEVESSGVRVAIGRGMAARVLVEPASAAPSE